MTRGPIPDFPADRPTVPKVLALARAYIDARDGWVSGPLHCYLMDGNTGRSFVQVDDQLVAMNDSEGAELARKLAAMTPTQRSKVYRHLRPRRPVDK